MSDTVICGAGIGGLATALALAKAGFSSLVLEKSDQLGEVGAGIQLAPNAFKALDRLGVAAAVQATAVQIDAIELRDMVSDEALVRFDTGVEFVSAYGFPYAVAHRAHLHEILLNACRLSGRVRIETGCEVVAVENGSSDSEVILRDERRFRADILVGADGINSIIRKFLISGEEPRLAGHTIYRTLIPVEIVPPELRRAQVTLWAGPHAHAVAYPISSGRLINLAITVDDGCYIPARGISVELMAVRSALSDVAGSLATLLSLSEKWLRWTLADRPPTPGWSVGCATLVGDAAHATLQYLAQGAALALEDALVLMEELSKTPNDVSSAMLNYESRRFSRTSSVQILSRAICESVYHATGTAADVRNTALKIMNQEQIRMKTHWLYGSSDDSYAHI
ncbi:FAD-dependent monooxygenase [Aureimonas ureilytica]|uniref:FAD-dependent monooxygenase n=1 Tax=Aureimonas ureilytica TaxID=401562 RepID=UPI0009E6BC71|nr:FAD-dependent monooxygenase [Aureimonas ureilytica]